MGRSKIFSFFIILIFSASSMASEEKIFRDMMKVTLFSGTKISVQENMENWRSCTSKEFKTDDCKKLILTLFRIKKSGLYNLISESNRILLGDNVSNISKLSLDITKEILQYTKFMIKEIYSLEDHIFNIIEKETIPVKGEIFKKFILLNLELQSRLIILKDRIFEGVK